MNVDIIQAKYDELETLAARFGQQAENNAAMGQRVRQVMAHLDKTGWEGKGAEAFQTEMSGEVFPAFDRLTQALQQSQSVTRQMITVMRQAEEEAAAVFGHKTETGTDGTKITTPQTFVDPSNPYLVRTVDSLYTDDYMSSFIDLKIRGEDNPQLNQAMQELYKNPQGAKLDKILNEIAEIRGVPPEELKTQYQKFLQIKEHVESVAEQKGIKPPGSLNESLHSNFMGSTAQLRFGKVVGDTFGLDPVFGALLSPTGGMVGADNWAYNPGDNDVLGYHAVFHDAAGYFYTYHNLGPGYDYLRQERAFGLDPASGATTGHISGSLFWSDKLYPDKNWVERVEITLNQFGDNPIDPGLVVMGPITQFFGNVSDKSKQLFDSLI